ncbi:two-component system CitB family response regulator [Agromyces sp. 3263]|uniref:response regulator n=1 Tax=Agromyces sp. 3263 TaxID=2817750 RepID=UPI00285F9346|nr:response regulator [Agromyces sp. 3263]MDR6906582.1 two-component system CitB family response regulator [Agromyces sp. 3263]
MTEPVLVLIVDDDFRVAGLHREIVAGRSGVQVLEPVYTAAAARAAVRDHAPDLLLADVYLPDGDGIALVRELDVDAFVITAASDAATVRRALRAGAHAMLIKPFPPALLAERIDAFVRFRNVLGADRTLDQEAVDRAVRILHGSASPIASRSPTEQLLLERLGDGECSAAEAAERAGISRATAQRHLSALVDRGLVEVSLRYGTTGRPEHRYRRRAGAGHVG